EFGLGLTRDRAEAVRWYRTAGASGSTQAAERLKTIGEEDRGGNPTYEHRAPGGFRFRIDPGCSPAESRHARREPGAALQQRRVVLAAAPRRRGGDRPPGAGSRDRRL